MKSVLKRFGILSLLVFFACIAGGQSEDGQMSPSDPSPFDSGGGDGFGGIQEGEHPETGSAPMSPFPILPPYPTNDTGEDDFAYQLKITFGCEQNYNLCSASLNKEDLEGYLAGTLRFEDLGISDEYGAYASYRLFPCDRDSDESARQFLGLFGSSENHVTSGFGTVIIWMLQFAESSMSCAPVLQPSAQPNSLAWECHITPADPGFCTNTLRIRPPWDGGTPTSELTADFSVSPINPGLNESVTFSPDSPTPAGRVYYCWIFSDELESRQCILPTIENGPAEVTRVFTQPGEVEVTLTLILPSGEELSQTKTVVIGLTDSAD